MANHLKKITALALVMILVLSVMTFGPIFKPVEVSAATVNTPLDFTSGKMLSSGDGWDWDVKTSTLTLTNIHLVTSGSAITLSLNSTIVLVGDNTIVSDDTYGIYGDGLTISGDGSLSIMSGRHGIYAPDTTNGNVTIHSGDVTISAGTIGGDYDGIHARNSIFINGGAIMVKQAGTNGDGISAKNVVINSGKIALGSYDNRIPYGMYPSTGTSQIEINNGTVSIYTNNMGIYADTVTVNGGMLILDSASSLGIYGDSVSLLGGSGTIKANGSAVYVSNLLAKCDNTVVLGWNATDSKYNIAAEIDKIHFIAADTGIPLTNISFGTAVILDLILDFVDVIEDDASGDGWDWAKATKILTLDGLDYAVTGKDFAIKLPDGATIALAGTNYVELLWDAKGRGLTIYALGSLNIVDITSGGTGELMIHAGGKSYATGIYAYGDVTIESGKIDITATDCGVYTLGSLTIEGGEITVYSTYSGLYAGKDIEKTGGTLDVAASSHHGIYADGDIAVNGGSGFAKTTNTSGKFAAVVAGGELTHHQDVQVLGHDGEAHTLPARPGPFNSQTFVNEDGAHHTNIKFGRVQDDDTDDDEDIDDDEDKDIDEDDKDDDKDNDNKKDDAPINIPPADQSHIHGKSHHQSDTMPQLPLVRRTASGQIVHYWEDDIGVYAVGSDTDLNHMVLIHYRYFPGRVAVNDTDIEIFAQFTPGYRNIDGILALRITLLANFLETLPVGQHKMEIFLEEGSVVAYFSVEAQAAEVDAPIAVAIPAWVNPFEDVRSSDWFYSDVQFVHERGLMIGTSLSPRLFSPHMTTTRGMFVTLLYRMAGTPSVSGLSNPFSDVAQGKWYADAAIWAAANGIVSSGETFGAMEALTREHMAVMMAHFISHMGYVLPSGEATAFADQDAISTWAQEAIYFMQTAGIIQGRPGNVFDPQGTATRAEVAAIIHRFLEMIEA